MRAVLIIFVLTLTACAGTSQLPEDFNASFDDF